MLDPFSPFWDSPLGRGGANVGSLDVSRQIGWLFFFFNLSADGEKKILRSRDNFKSYYDRGVFVIVGAAIFTPPP